MTTVLVVDDSAVDRRFVGRLLEKTFPCTIKYATDGVEALARMKDALPDLIVTDLTMPVMDGLELVKSVRTHHPNVPVILMTAYGSEELAVKALSEGAASYVPKVQLADKLQDTMAQVLALANADQGHKRLIGCLTGTEFRFRLENDAALIDPLAELVGQMVTGMGLTDFTGRLQVGVAIKEALLNALFYGSLEISKEEMEAVEDKLLEGEEVSLVERRRSQPPYRDRRIFVDMKLSPEEARFVIRDEGRGFDAAAVPDPDEPGALEPEGGRGLSLMRAFMDEVTFNDAGNEVTMVKRRDTGGDKAGDAGRRCPPRGA